MAPERLRNTAVMYYALKTEDEVVVLRNINTDCSGLVCDDGRWGREEGLAQNHMQ